MLNWQRCWEFRMTTFLFLTMDKLLNLIRHKSEKKVDPHIQTGYLFIDGLGVGDVGEVVIKDRQVMSEDGMFVIIITVDRKSGKLLSQPE